MSDKVTHVVESHSGRKLTINGKPIVAGTELTEREIEILNKHPMAHQREVVLKPIGGARPAPTPNPS